MSTSRESVVGVLFKGPVQPRRECSFPPLLADNVLTAKDMEQGGPSYQGVADGRDHLDHAVRLDSHGEKTRHIDSLQRLWSPGVDDSVFDSGFHKVIQATNA